jgi:hypothetical protein
MSMPSFGGAGAWRGGDHEHQHGRQHRRQEAHLLVPGTRVLYFGARRRSSIRILARVFSRGLQVKNTKLFSKVNFDRNPD